MSEEDQVVRGDRAADQLLMSPEFSDKSTWM